MKIKISNKGKSYNFDIRITLEHLPKENMVDIFKDKKELKTRIKQFKYNSREFLFLRKELLNKKVSLRKMNSSLWKVCLSLGKRNFEYLYFSFPNHKDLKYVIKDTIKFLAESRLKYNNVYVENRNFMGIKYKMIGGVFTEKNTILKLPTMINNFDRIEKRKVPSTKLTDPYIGVELEFISKVCNTDIKKNLIKNNLAGNVQLHDDTSIQTEEDFNYTSEITILSKQEYIEDIITRTLSSLKEGDNVSVNNSCGYHVHFDVRKRNPALVYKNLVRILPLLNKLVPITRWNGEWADKYCMQNPTDDLLKAFSVRTKHHTGKYRYQAINPDYNKYNTIEVRLHGGTLNKNKILNWIKICLYAVESQVEIPVIDSLVGFINYFDPPISLIHFMEKRIQLFDKYKESIDTKIDHNNFNEVA